MEARYVDRSTADRRYVPSQFDGPYVNDEHRRIVEVAADVPGKLQAADQLKLYEMAWFARGPILELGLDQGKSLSIMARAVVAARSGVPITSVELGSTRIAAASENLRGLGLLEHVRLVVGRSAEVIPSLKGSYDLVFVDGDHSYAGVKADMEALRGRVRPGGAIAFHDFWDARNDDPANRDYGVRAAVHEMAPRLGLAFRGGFGAIGLFEQAQT